MFLLNPVRGLPPLVGSHLHLLIMSSQTSDTYVESLLQKLRDALVQVKKQAGTPTSSQTAALNSWLDLLRLSPEKLKMHSQQPEHERRVAQRAACTVYSSIGHETFILFAYSILAPAICERRILNQFVPAFRGW